MIVSHRTKCHQWLTAQWRIDNIISFENLTAKWLKCAVNTCAPEWWLSFLISVLFGSLFISVTSTSFFLLHSRQFWGSWREWFTRTAGGKTVFLKEGPYEWQMDHSDHAHVHVLVFTSFRKAWYCCFQIYPCPTLIFIRLSQCFYFWINNRVLSACPFLFFHSQSSRNWRKQKNRIGWRVIYSYFLKFSACHTVEGKLHLISSVRDVNNSIDKFIC